MMRVFLVSALLGVTVSCGGPVDEFWKGDFSDCTSNGATATMANGTKAILVLEGPVTLLPKGQFGEEDKYGNRSLRPFGSATYIGPMLSFSYETKFETSTSKTEGTLTRTPISMDGEVKTTSGSSEVKCKVSLKPDP